MVPTHCRFRHLQVQREMQHAINQIGEHWPQLLI
jgi:hypothetical protein